MLVQPSNFLECLEEIKASPYIALDTETTGLDWFKGDRLFSISIATKTKEYYFDKMLLNGAYIPKILEGYTGIIFMHFAKFDMHMLAREGVDVRQYDIHCTAVGARIDKNVHISLSLANLGGLIGYKKLDLVKEYILQNKLYEEVDTLGLKKSFKRMHYDKVPLDLMQPYAEKDARITYELGMKQLNSLLLKDTKNLSTLPSLFNILETEKKLTKVLFDMEEIGVKIDLDYAKKARVFERDMAEKGMREFEALTGRLFVDSNKLFSAVFRNLGIDFPITDKGNPSFVQLVLERMKHPIANAILKYRKAHKSATTYYGNFLWYADEEGVLHANTNPAGTFTGRLSYSSPNLQNLTKMESEGENIWSEFYVRRCFIPREDFIYFMFDYDQMEYRLLLDYAKEEKLIEEINRGKNVHQATADLVGINKRFAKTMNYMLLYGGGANLLGEMLGITYLEAKDLISLYFSKMPNVKRFLFQVRKIAFERGYVINWAGRRYDFGAHNSEYKAPNYLIQGGSADIIKKAMVEIDACLAKARSRMLIQIHDELLFEIHKSELNIIQPIKMIMESAYRPELLPLTVKVEFSEKSWQDKEIYKGG